MAPEPTTAIAAILQLTDQQRFDLMEVPAEILEQRRSGAGQIIVDVRLADGSTSSRLDGKTQKHPCATMPLTIFLRGTAELEDFKQHVGCNPLLFMCLNGQVGKQGLEVGTA